LKARYQRLQSAVQLIANVSYQCSDTSLCLSADGAAQAFHTILLPSMLNDQLAMLNDQLDNV